MSSSDGSVGFMGKAPQLDLAERVAKIANDCGIVTALIGAAAFAAHNYVRATLGVDLATCVNPFIDLRRLEDALRACGLRTELRLPDADDPLAGVLEVWEFEDEEGDPIRPCELVNFDNPHRPTPNPGRQAIVNSLPLDAESNLRYVTLADLIALKIYSGSRQDHLDVVELLARNRDADLDGVRAAASPYDRNGVLEALILDAAATR